MNPPEIAVGDTRNKTNEETVTAAGVEEQVFRAGVRFDPVKAGLPLNVESQCMGNWMSLCISIGIVWCRPGFEHEGLPHRCRLCLL